MQHTQMQRPSLPHTHPEETKSPALIVQMGFQQSYATLPHRRIKLAGGTLVFSKLFSIQESHLWLCAPYRSPDKWDMGFITQLLQVTQAQWIYRCLLVHDHTSGRLANLHKPSSLRRLLISSRRGPIILWRMISIFWNATFRT